MGGGMGGSFGNTKGTKASYRHIISSLPKNPNNLTKKGWTNTTPTGMSQNTSSQMFTNKNNGMRIRFDKGKKGATGYGAKDHYHILNPNSTGKHDYYLDKNGKPVPKNSKASHIIP